MTKFDSSRAWRDASAAVAANREVLPALAGVFFLLPWLAFMLLAPEPQMKPGMAPDQMFAVLRSYLAEVGPYLLALTLVETCGTLAVLTLCTDRSRPTVGEAIRRGAFGVLPYLGAMLMFALGFALVTGLLGAIVGLAAGKGGAAAVGLLMNGVLVYATIRLVMVAPVIAVERITQPWRVLTRSWALTQGNVARILLFLLLLVIASQVAMAVIGMIVGSVATLVAGQAGGRIAEAVASAAMIAVFLLYMASVLAAMHDQLAGPWREADGAVFR